MNNKLEVMTTHQKIQEAHLKNTAEFTGEAARLRTAQHVATSDIEQIKMVLQALMDKLEGLNLYVRSLHASSNLGKMQPMSNVAPQYEATQKTSIDFDRPIEAADVVVCPRETKLIEGEVDDSASDSA